MTATGGRGAASRLSARARGPRSRRRGRARPCQTRCSTRSRGCSPWRARRPARGIASRRSSAGCARLGQHGDPRHGPHNQGRAAAAEPREQEDRGGARAGLRRCSRLRGRCLRLRNRGQWLGRRLLRRRLRRVFEGRDRNGDLARLRGHEDLAGPGPFAGATTVTLCLPGWMGSGTFSAADVDGFVIELHSEARGRRLQTQDDVGELLS